MKTNKYLIVLLCIVSVTTIWVFEITKPIPRYGIVLYQLGLGCNDECGQEQQLQYFQKAVHYKSNIIDTEYNNMLSDAHYRSALIYENIGNTSEALESYRRAVEYNQGNVMAHYNMGVHYFREEAYDLASRYFQRALRGSSICPSDTVYYMAKICDKQEKYTDALSWYHSFVESYPEYVPEVYPQVAEMYRQLNDPFVVFYKLHMLRQYQKHDLADQLEQHLKAAEVSWDY